MKRMNFKVQFAGTQLWHYGDKEFLIDGLKVNLEDAKKLKRYCERFILWCDAQKSEEFRKNKEQQERKEYERLKKKYS